MLLRRCRRLVPIQQGLHDWGLRSVASGPPQDASSPDKAAGGDHSTAESLLSYWRGMLDDRQRVPGRGLDADDARQLLHTALRLRHGKVQSSLPEQLLALFLQYYRQLDAPARLALYRSLTSHLGVQAAEVDRAVAAWEQLRQAQQAEAQAIAAAGAPPPAPTAACAAEPLHKAAERLAAAATPLYCKLFVPLSQQPGGIKFLVDMRAQLLQAIQAKPSGAAPLRALGDALRASLAEWFSVGLLQLRRISWEGSSAALLEKVAAGEAVHPLSGWADLKARLDSQNRRVYAFFHEAMPGEPLVVLHTALTGSVATSMQQVLPPSAEAALAAAAAAGQTAIREQQQQQRLHHAYMPTTAHGAVPPPSERTWEQQQQQPQQQLPPAADMYHEQQQDTAGRPQGEQQQQQGGQQQQPQPSVAVFYSISSTQPGLAGVDLGNFLIKQVAHRVQAEFPSVRALCTLSPLPGFADWIRLQLARAVQGLPPPVTLLLPNEAAQLEPVAAGHLPSLLTSASTAGAAGQQAQQEWEQRAALVLGWVLREDPWLHSARLETAARGPLLRLAAHYLLRERRRGLALDPVANFHLRNGASVLQLNWRADVSPTGLRRSHGIMVNYHYELPQLHDNNRAYLADGRVTAAPEVEALLAGGS